MFIYLSSDFIGSTSNKSDQAEQKTNQEISQAEGEEYCTRDTSLNFGLLFNNHSCIRFCKYSFYRIVSLAKSLAKEAGHKITAHTV